MSCGLSVLSAQQMTDDLSKPPYFFQRGLGPVTEMTCCIFPQVGQDFADDRRW